MMGLGLSSALIAPQAFAQDEENVIEEVITIGTRGKPRTVTESPAPVDVFTAAELLNQGDTDVSNLLRNSVPSYNVNDQPISDAATLVRPANLRGLAPDHTLILVNGKRRHRASVITWLGNGISNGSQGPDAAAIPALALKNVEILRDGAAAQYGSDAIAGVMNFVLNDANEGLTLEAKVGQYSEGDGTTATIAGNYGFPIGANGFGNITAEYGNSDPTDRAVQRGDAQGLIDDGIQGVPVPAMIWGRPDVQDDIKVFGNFGYDVGAGREIYGHANYNTKTVDGGFFYRNPENRGAVFGADGNLLVADLLDAADGVLDGSAGCGTFSQSYTDPVSGEEVSGLLNPAFIAGVINNPDCFHLTELPQYQGGFTPRFGGDIVDNSILVGFRGETARGIGWDFSAYRGSHESDFFINNTVNASLGPDSPLNFDPGAYEQIETNFNADFSYPISTSVNLGFGAEYRNEEFTITSGQIESFTAGPLADQGFSTSSNGFPGFPDITSGTFDRTNSAVYGDLEWDASDKLLVQAALRFEDFDDFGSTTNYKLGANYRVNDDFGLRGTVSTGFKAPEVNLTDAQIAELVAEGVPGAGDLANFRFFTNDFDTKTSGVDVVVSTSTDWLGGTTDWNLAYNNTSTDVVRFNPDTVGAARIRQIEETTPKTRWNFSGNHSFGNWRTLARLSYYSQWYDSFEVDVFGNDTDGIFGNEFLVDVEAGYDFNDSNSLLFGVNNLFNNKGETTTQANGLGFDTAVAGVGNVYSTFSPFGFSGTYYYLRYRYTR